MKKILVVTVLLFLILNSCSSTKFSKQDLIIPKSYRGEIWIFYDQSYNKGKFKKSWNKITFYVPKDGIIFSKYKPRDIIDQEQYNDDNKKVFITEYLDKDNGIYLDGGSVGTVELSSRKKLNYSIFLVGDEKSLDNMFKKSNDHKYVIKKYEENVK